MSQTSTAENTGKLAVLFPGQGSQYVGMAKMLREQFPWTREIYEEASDSIKRDILSLCLDGPADELTLTENAQPCILTTSYAWFQVLRRDLDLRPSAAAGHSLGEYTALLASGAMTLGEAVALVRKRGQLMQNAVPPGKGKMAAVLGLDDEKVSEICKLASQGESSLVVPANFNAPAQVVIAGHTAAVERAEAIAGGGDPERPELKARKVLPLKVSAPFHCPLMKSVADAFVPYLQGVRWQEMAFPVANNLDAKVRRNADLVPLLRDQIDHPVRWTACAQELNALGHTLFVEVGPGKVLTGLVKRIVTGATQFAVDSLEELRALEAYFKEGR